MSKRIRVLMQTALPPPSGGMGTWTRNLLDSHLAETFDIRVIDINVGDLDASPTMLAARKTAIAARSVAQFPLEIARFRPHIVHVCSAAHPPGLIRDTPALHIASAAGAATLLHIHGSATRLGKRPALLPVLRRLLSPLDAIVVLNEDSLLHALSYGFSSVHRLPNSIARRPPPKRDWPITDRPVQFLFVGWLKPAKGVLDLLKAFRSVPNAELTLLGRWVVDAQGVVRKDEVRALMEEPSLQGRVHLAGEVPLERVWDYYDAADVFVLPSWTEGFPMSLLESMMAGMPAVVSRVGAMADAVRHGESGFVVEPRDVDGLADAMRTVVEQRQHIPAWGAAARQRALDDFTHEVVHKQLGRLWRSLVR